MEERMTKIYTLTLAPSLDSATQTPQIYPEGKLRCSAPCLNPAAAESTLREPSLSWRQRHRHLSRRRRHRRTPDGAADG
jgi:hypothetical protein